MKVRIFAWIKVCFVLLEANKLIRQPEDKTVQPREILGASEGLAVHMTVACHVLHNIRKDKSKIFARSGLE